nr:class I SAM-dependent methyltransferase [uncultured Roseateles sp.]
MNALLIFPAVTADAWEQARTARAEGRPFVFAGSMTEPPVGAPADAAHHWAVLPTVHDPEFASAFRALVEARRINAIFAPVPSVHAFLKRFLSTSPMEAVLVNEAPIERQVRLLGEMESLSAELRKVERFASAGAAGVDDLELRAVVEAAMGTYGESGAEKIAALAGIMATAVPGDVVEIGALMGRSAVALRLLARRFGVGPVLTVDPWAPGEAVQADSPAAVRDDLIGQWDYERLARGFASRMYALGDTDFAHLRLPSRLAHEQYLARRSIHYPPFKPAHFSGEIAVLHIDGNHDYAAVRDDWSRWGQQLKAGAWVIFDDYVWAHGDGPRRLGDEVLRRNQGQISRTFVQDKALFVHFHDRPDLL